jgi:hypothetical protein
MSVSKLDAVEMLDKIMGDGKWRSPKTAQKLLAAKLSEAAKAGWDEWFRLRSGPVDNGLRWKEHGPLSGEKDAWGKPMRYFAYRIVGEDKRQPGGEDILSRTPEQIEADRQAVLRRVGAEGQAELDAQDRAYRLKHGIPEEI